MITKIKILKIIKGAVYENIVYDYWMNVELENGKRIIVFNDKYLDKTECFISKYLQVELSSVFITEERDNELFSFKGEVISSNNEYYFVGDNIKIKVPITKSIALNIILVE